MHTSQPPRHWSSDRAGGYSRSGKAGRRFLIIGMTALVFVLTVAAGADTYRKMGSSAGFERVPPILSAETPLPPTDEPVQSGEPSTALPVFNGPFEKPPRCKVEGKKAYLTFDDGPDAEITPRVLDILKEKGVPATFFIVGDRLVDSESRAGIVRRMEAEGHAIGCHSYTHRARTGDGDRFIYASVDAFAGQFPLWEASVREVLGHDLAYKVMRFPNGSSNGLLKPNYLGLLEATNAAGYMMFDWNTLTNDSQTHTKAEGVSLVDFERNCFLETLNTQERYANSEPVIVLMHDIFYGDALCSVLPWMIDELRWRGYEFGRCDELNGSYLH